MFFVLRGRGSINSIHLHTAPYNKHQRYSKLSFVLLSSFSISSIHPQQWLQLQLLLGRWPPLPSSRCWSCLAAAIQRRGHCAATAHRCAIQTAPLSQPPSAAVTATPHRGATVAKPRSSSTARTAATAMARAPIPAATTAASATAAHAAVPAVTSS
jgi:hypothetical protein